VRLFFERLAGAPIGRNPSRSAQEREKIKITTLENANGKKKVDARAVEVKTNEETHAEVKFDARCATRVSRRETWPCQHNSGRL
jgi:hypothetical protein